MADKKDKKSEKILDIDRVIHEPARYLIIANLYTVEAMDFVFLKNQTGLTQGNLSSHLGKLESIEYIEINKEFIDKKPCTMLNITEKGIKAFEDYKKSMKSLL